MIKNTRISFVLSLLIFTAGLVAQDVVVTGRVTDAGNGEGLIGVTIYPKGKISSGTATDFDGNYELICEAGDTLEFNFLGYITHNEVVGSQSEINVVMTPESMELDEVVITALGNSNWT